MSGAPAVLLRDILARLQGMPATVSFVSERGDETVRSFDDLHRDASALAARLRRMGVRPGHRIGLLAPNSYHWLVWDLAVTDVQGISVAFPQERVDGPLQPLLTRHELQLLAVDPALVAPAELEHGSVLAYDQPGDDAGKALSGHPSALPAGTHSLVFSSGTTGKTKGLIISAPGTENLLNLYGQAFGVAADDRMLTFLPFANYQQRMAYYFCLYHGIDFAYVPFARLFPGLKKYRPSYVIAPPVFYESLQNMARSVAPSKPGQPAAPVDIAARLAELLGGRIRYLITGMAPIKRHTLDFFWQQGIALYEAFGITEAGMVAWNKPGFVKLGTVGMPAEQGSVTLGEDGEVIISRQALLSFGYFDAPDDDVRNTFVGPNSVATGDIATFDADGYLTIVGRKKDAILTRAGEKFHPESVEALIQSHPDVDVAVVLGGDGLPGITAIVSTQKAFDAAACASIRQHIDIANLALPVFQQVKRVEFTPLQFSIANDFRTKNMKLNRKAIHGAFVLHGIGLGQAATEQAA